MMRTAIKFAQEKDEKIASLVDQFHDPVFENLLVPPNVMDRSTLQSAKEATVTKSELAISALDKIDSLMKKERDRVLSALPTSMTDDIRDSLLGDVDKRHATERVLYARQIGIYKKFYDTHREIIEFLLNYAGQYRLATDNRTLVFNTDETVARFNALLEPLNDVARKEEKLSADIVAYRAYLAKRTKELHTPR